MRIALTMLLVFATECDRRLPQSFAIAFSAATDDDQPLSGLAVMGGLPSGNSIRFGATGANGRLEAHLDAMEGSQLDVRATCPARYEPSGSMSALVTLRQFSGVGRNAPEPLRFSFRCRGVERLAAVLIRAGGQKGLPVLLDGRPIGRTGAEGIAHLLLRLPGRGSFKVGLDTTSRPDLRPKSPVATYVMRGADEIFVLDQPFEKRRKARAPDPAPRRIRSVGESD